MNKIVLFIILMLMPTLAVADEVIATMDAAGLSTLNEELRQSSSGLKNLKGQVADLLPLDLSDTTKMENALPIANGGTGATTAQGAMDLLTIPTSGTDGQVWATNGTHGGWTTVNGEFDTPTSGSTVLLHSADTELPGQVWSYSIAKSISVPRPGVYTISFDLKSVDTNPINRVYGRLYKNGTAIGTERTTLAGTWVTYTEDVTLAKGDAIQLYAYSTRGTCCDGPVAVRNFRVYTGTVSTYRTIRDSF